MAKKREGGKQAGRSGQGENCMGKKKTELLVVNLMQLIHKLIFTNAFDPCYNAMLVLSFVLFFILKNSNPIKLMVIYLIYLIQKEKVHFRTAVFIFTVKQQTEEHIILFYHCSHWATYFNDHISFGCNTHNSLSFLKTEDFYTCTSL